MGLGENTPTRFIGLREAFGDATSDSASRVVDLSEVEFLDSTALGC